MHSFHAQADENAARRTTGTRGTYNIEDASSNFIEARLPRPAVATTVSITCLMVQPAALNFSSKPAYVYSLQLCKPFAQPALRDATEGGRPSMSHGVRGILDPGCVATAEQWFPRKLTTTKKDGYLPFEEPHEFRIR